MQRQQKESIRSHYPRTLAAFMHHSERAYDLDCIEIPSTRMAQQHVAAELLKLTKRGTRTVSKRDSNKTPAQVDLDEKNQPPNCTWFSEAMQIMS